MNLKTFISIMIVAVVLCGFNLLPRSLPMAEAAPAKKFSRPTQSEVDPAKRYEATIKTAKGVITIELYPKEAPLSVTNFINLAKGGFYNGLNFHRVEPGFVVQGGDPAGNGTGGPGYTIPAEISPLRKHVEGAVAAARLPDQANPKREGSGSQFYITLAPTPFLDHQYTVFGKVLTGMDVVKKIQRGDKIETIAIAVK